jgi:hypothetical protein
MKNFNTNSYSADLFGINIFYILSPILRVKDYNIILPDV